VRIEGLGNQPGWRSIFEKMQMMQGWMGSWGAGSMGWWGGSGMILLGIVVIAGIVVIVRLISARPDAGKSGRN
jgi:hypothetical protein